MIDREKQIADLVQELGLGTLRSMAPLPGGLTNENHVVETEQGRFVVRFNGDKNNPFLDRRAEAALYEVLRTFDPPLADTVYAICPDEGYKVSRYEDHHPCRSDSEADVAAVLDTLRRVHTVENPPVQALPIREAIAYYESTVQVPLEPWHHLREVLWSRYDALGPSGRPSRLIHFDAHPGNFLMLPDGRALLVDWEYSFCGDPFWDVAYFAVCSGYEPKETEQLLAGYLQRPPTEEERRCLYAYRGILCYCNLLWSLSEKPRQSEVPAWTKRMEGSV